VAVDCVALAHAVGGVRAFSGGATVATLHDALTQAYAYEGIALLHISSYYGDNPLGSIEAYGAWNVGNWCAQVQRRYHEQGL
jgi:3D-(3,5/4)-trihydroxycyclohexane-1,2-dione acylhydrolase (decyclizing)